MYPLVQSNADSFRTDVSKVTSNSDANCTNDAKYSSKLGNSTHNDILRTQKIPARSRKDIPNRTIDKNNSNDCAGKRANKSNIEPSHRPRRRVAIVGELKRRFAK